MSNSGPHGPLVFILPGVGWGGVWGGRGEEGKLFPVTVNFFLEEILLSHRDSYNNS